MVGTEPQTPRLGSQVHLSGPGGSFMLMAASRGRTWTKSGQLGEAVFLDHCQEERQSDPLPLDPGDVMKPPPSPKASL